MNRTQRGEIWLIDLGMVAKTRPARQVSPAQHGCPAPPGELPRDGLEDEPARGLADGRVFSADEALEKGLVDKLGYKPIAIVGFIVTSGSLFLIASAASFQAR